jgi:hypothetical protein
VAVAALVIGILSVLGAILQAPVLVAVRPVVAIQWTEVANPLLPLVGIGLALNALFRVADPKERVSGEGMAWIALLLNLLATPPNVCCFGLRMMGNWI